VPVKTVDLYTDGGCGGNPGPGGYAAILVYNGLESDPITGHAPDTTNNRMELSAVIAGLSALNERCRVRIHADSTYVVKAFSEGWLEAWKRKGWTNSKRQLVPNRDLWEQLDALVAKHEVEWVWVRGHDGHDYNERCDELAVAAYQHYR
jgi:ribonuclease HI